jgi:hypothetical protein
MCEVGINLTKSTVHVFPIKQDAPYQKGLLVSLVLILGGRLANLLHSPDVLLSLLLFVQFVLTILLHSVC